MKTSRNLRAGYNLRLHSAGVAELVDAVDSKSTVGDIVRVRVPPSVPRRHSRTSDKVFLSLVNNDLRTLRRPFSFKGVRLKPGAYGGTIGGIC